MSQANIIVKALNFRLANSKVHFKNIHLSLDNNLTGLVGDNGIGKSTFLKLIHQDYQPDSGVIQTLGKVVLVPQFIDFKKQDVSILSYLEIDKIMQSLENIAMSNYQESDLDLADGHWDLEQRLSKLFERFDLASISYHCSLKKLSGGQQTKLKLIYPLLHQADYILFDEPTNHLDEKSRHLFYHYLENLSVGALICSHDRVLLSRLHAILEMTQKGIHCYGGNYDFYLKQKTITENALNQEIKEKKESLKKTKNSIQSRLEKHQKNQAKGHKAKDAQIKAKGQYDKISLNSKKGKSEKCNQRIRTQVAKMLNEVNYSLVKSQEQLDIKKSMSSPMLYVSVPANKKILTIENLSFSYQKDKPLFKNFNLSLYGPKRIAISGDNGAGKSTLLKLISGELKQSAGIIDIGVQSICYIRQNLQMLKPQLNLIENYQCFHPTASIEDAHLALAAFNFRNEAAKKSYHYLSGGEKLKATLAIHLFTPKKPQLILIDEINNHLDLLTLSLIEQALKNYNGAIICISHDKKFLKNIGIDEIVPLPDKSCQELYYN